MNSTQTQYLNDCSATPNKLSFNDDTDISDASISVNTSNGNSSMTPYDIASQETNHSSLYSRDTLGNDECMTLCHEDAKTENDAQPEDKMEVSDSSTKFIQNQHQLPSNNNNNNTGNDQKRSTYTFTETLNQYGYEPIYRIAMTLQGQVWRAHSKQLNTEVVIKITNKMFAANRIGVDHQTNEWVNDCQEDIYNEIRLLHALNNTASKPRAMIGLLQVFQDAINIFVVMEDGGRDFLHFINECHAAIRSRRMSVDDWKQTAKLLFRQIAEFVHWLHSVPHVCFLDISLENMTIQNVEKEHDAQTNTYRILPSFQLKFCDFGVANEFTKTKREVLAENDSQHIYDQHMEDEDDEEQGEEEDDEVDDDDEMNELDAFSDEEDENESEEDEEEEDLDAISFECAKFVGKVKYECPEIFNRERFDARKADIWSMAVVFFMICLGSTPWKMPCATAYGSLKVDAAYDRIVVHQDLKTLLIQWRRQQYLDEDAYDLFYRMCADHMYRISTEEILAHSWMQPQSSRSSKLMHNEQMRMK